MPYCLTDHHLNTRPQGDFVLGQSIGYGLNIDFLKIYLSIDNGRGVSYSLASTVIPIIVAFLISFIYKIFNKRTTNR